MNEEPDFTKGSVYELIFTKNGKTYSYSNTYKK